MLLGKAHHVMWGNIIVCAVQQHPGVQGVRKAGFSPSEMARRAVSAKQRRLIAGSA